MKLNLGCGKKPTIGNDWVNVDLVQVSKNPRAIFKLMDVRDIRKNFADNSIDEIYSSHLIEHFYKHEIRVLLRDMYRILEPRGIITLKTPDFGLIVKAWNDHTLTTEYLSRLIFGWDAFVGDREMESNMLHRFLFDRGTFREYLEDAGFVHIDIHTQPEPLEEHLPELSMEAVAYKKRS